MIMMDILVKLLSLQSLSCEQFLREQQSAKPGQGTYSVKNDDGFGANPTYDTCGIVRGNNANLHTAGAQYFKKKYNFSLDEYIAYVIKCNGFETVPAECQPNYSSLPKYRSIDGRGNNLNNPEWGASDTPFKRFAPNNYKDGINTVAQSVEGGELPNPRYIVQNVLKPALRAPPPALSYGVFALMTVLFITHDVHYQTPIQPPNGEQEYQCCTANNQGVLYQNPSNQACYPISIPKNDTFYEGSNVGCINLVRSQKSEYTNKVQPGEIMNRATSFLDLSLIYCNHDSELVKIRLKTGGLFRMGRNNILPVDINNQYIPSMRRFTMVPMASIWPALFTRNHNHLATRLAALNPTWNDEKLFQEARRINIATFQYNLITSKAVEASISNIPINEKYDATRNTATTLEFSIAYRMAHYYIHDNMLFQDAQLNNRTVKQSDTVGHIELLEDDFDGALRGALAEVVNAGNYSDEITNRIGKNPNGYGSDIITIDIQRARDQGLASYVAIRKLCGLKPEVNCFDDLYKFLNKTNVDLLKKAYKNVNDIDYYVGGTMETYEILGNPLVGPTFGCVIARQWDNFAGGDIYYYSNPSSPNPFNQAQLWAIGNYTISNLLCANSGMTQTAKVWPYAPNPTVNPLVNCTTFPKMDLTSWKE